LSNSEVTTVFEEDEWDEEEEEWEETDDDW
jgi:hypothetical protein